ncbi:MAG: hypothetical protein WBP56_14490 [Polyangia bacterium]
MRENCPFPATQANALPAAVPTVSPPSPRGVAGHSVAKYPHRRVFVDASWRSARAWIERAYPSGLDAARPELVTAYPELAANVDRLELAAHQAANVFENTPEATGDAFQVALRTWEAAVLDACAALASVPPGRATP